MRNAACTTRREAASIPARRMPITLTARAVAGVPTAITNGGMSLFTFEQPPT